MKSLLVGRQRSWKIIYPNVVTLGQKAFTSLKERSTVNKSVFSKPSSYSGTMRPNDTTRNENVL